MKRPFRRGLLSRVGLMVGAPMTVSEVSPAALQARVQALLDLPAPK